MSVTDEETSAPQAGGRSAKATGQRWTRWIHVYTSMISLVLVLFFGVTGITLNHPEWTFGDDPTMTTRDGSLTGDVTPDGDVDFLAISEQLRSRVHITAPVSDHRTDGAEASISYRSPGYAADATVDLDAQTYTVTIEQQGWVGVINDLHKGRDSDRSWRWLIDVSAGFLVLISLTGLLLQLFLRRRRRSALILAALGLVVSIVFAVLTL